MKQIKNIKTFHWKSIFLGGVAQNWRCLTRCRQLLGSESGQGLSTADVTNMVWQLGENFVNPISTLLLPVIHYIHEERLLCCPRSFTILFSANALWRQFSHTFMAPTSFMVNAPMNLRRKKCGYCHSKISKKNLL